MSAPVLSSLFNNPNVNSQLIFGSLSSRFVKGFKAVAPDWTKIATKLEVPSMILDFPWFDGIPTMREWKGNRQIHEVKPYNYRLTAVPWESTLRFSEFDLKYGALRDLGIQFDELAIEAANSINRAVWKQLLLGFTTGLGYDGVSFFNDAHPLGDYGVGDNFINGVGDPWFLLYTGNSAAKPILVNEIEGIQTEEDYSGHFMRREILVGTSALYGLGYGRWQYAIGSKATLDYANFSEAKRRMLLFKDSNGNPLGIRPDLLVYHPNLQEEVDALFDSPLINGGDTNPVAGTIQTYAAPYLDQTV